MKIFQSGSPTASNTHSVKSSDSSKVNSSPNRRYLGVCMVNAFISLSLVHQGETADNEDPLQEENSR